MYTSNIPSMIERQCLAVSPWVGLYRPLGLRFWSEVDAAGSVVAWKLGGDYLRDTITIWMDGRPHPSPNAQFPLAGFTTGKWEGDTLVARTTHVKTAWIRRGNGIPGSDQTTFTVYLTRRDDLLTITTIQEIPFYLTEPHVVSRVWQFDPRGNQGGRNVCNTANEVPRFEDSGIVPHYLPGQNPEADFMTRTYNIPKEAAMGHAETLYPEYRKKIKGTYAPRGVRAVLLWMDRTSGPARRRPESHVQRRRVRRFAQKAIEPNETRFDLYNKSRSHNQVSSWLPGCCWRLSWCSMVRRRPPTWATQVRRSAGLPTGRRSAPWFQGPEARRPAHGSQCRRPRAQLPRRDCPPHTHVPCSDVQSPNAFTRQHAAGHHHLIVLVCSGDLRTG